MRFVRFAYRWLEAPVQIRGVEWYSTDLFGVGLILGALLGIWWLA